MKKLFFLGIVLGVALNASAQTKVDMWAVFAKTKFEAKYEESLKEYIFAPVFPPDVKDLNGKEITIEGFYVPYDGDDFIIISKYPQSQCFFCGGGGPESVAEVKFKGQVPKFRTDDLITVKGKLKLNEKDLEHMNFIVTDAVLVSK